jgi:hypothetical protein
MSTPKRLSPKVKPVTTPILLREFPVTLHRAMKAEAAQRGVRVGTLYVEACEQFLPHVGKHGGKDRG